MQIAERQRLSLGAESHNWRDGKWECPLGRLYMFGGLAPREHGGWKPESLYEAGVKWRNLVVEVRRIYKTPPPFAASADLAERIGRGGETAEIDPGYKQEVTDNYQQAFGALLIAGRRAQLAVNAVVIQERPVVPEDLAHVRDGLYALAVHFGLTGARKSSYHGRNSS